MVEHLLSVEHFLDVTEMFSVIHSLTLLLKTASLVSLRRSTGRLLNKAAPRYMKPLLVWLSLGVVIAMVFACRWGNIPSSCLLSFNLLLKYFGSPEEIARKTVMIVAKAVSWFTLRLPACLTSTSVGVSRPSPDFNLRILF